MVGVIDTSGNFKTAYYLNGGGGSRAFSVIINPDESYSLTGYLATAAKGRESFT